MTEEEMKTFASLSLKLVQQGVMSAKLTTDTDLVIGVTFSLPGACAACDDPTDVCPIHEEV